MKRLEIDRCGQCPYFDDEYYSYNRECVKLKKQLPEGQDILEDCPLEDA